MCLIKITFLAKGTNRDIYRSITIVVKDVCARARAHTHPYLH